MKNKILNSITTLIILILAYNCSAQKIVDTKDSSRVAKVRLLKSKLNLTDIQVSKIIDNDSIVDQVVLSLKDSIVASTVKVKLDSFYAGKYDTTKTWLLLKLQLRYKNLSFETVSEKNSAHFPEFKTIEELAKYYDKVDSILKKPIIMVKVDSTKKKNH